MIYSQNAITHAAYEGAYYGMLNPTDINGIKAEVLDVAVGVPLQAVDIEISCEPCYSGAAIAVAINYRFESLFTPLVPSFTLHASAKYYIQ